MQESIKAAERFTGRSTYMKVLAVEFAPVEVAEYLRRKSDELGVYLIIGKEYEVP